MSLPSLANRTGRSLHAHGHAIFVNQTAADFYRCAAARLGNDLSFVSGLGLFVQFSAKVFARVFQVTGRYEVRKVFADDFLARVTGELFSRSIHGNIPSL